MRKIAFTIMLLLSLLTMISCGSQPQNSEDVDYEKYQEEYEAGYEEHAREQELDYLYQHAVPYDSAIDYVGQEILVFGNVADIYHSKENTGSPLFINVGEAYPSSDRFTIVIWEEHLDDILPYIENIKTNDTIFVEGYVDSYDGVAQIEVTDISQITHYQE